MTPECLPTPDDVAGVIEADPCGRVLSVDGASARIVPLTVGADPVVLEGPPPCAARPCEWAFHGGPTGDFAVVSLTGLRSEAPEGAWLVLEDGAPIDLWPGQPVRVDSTWIGPTHALAPAECGGSMGLVVVPRLPGATAEPPSSLSKLAGPLAPVDEGTPVPACVALDVSLP